MCEGGALQVGVDLFDERVAAVSLVRGHRVVVLGAGGGEEGVGAPSVEQRVLTVLAARVAVGDPADHEPAGSLTPATIPATSEATFNPAFAPLSVGTDKRLSANSCSPAVRARVRTGTSPEDDTRLGSSNTADLVRGA